MTRIPQKTKTVAAPARPRESAGRKSAEAAGRSNGRR